MINYLTVAISILAIWIALLSLALNFGLLDRWFIYVAPRPRGWHYWPWAWRFYREHGSWPV